jgi:hypothetical protein
VSDAFRFRVVRPLSPARTGPVIEAQPEALPDKRAVIWPGTPPVGQLPSHVGLARPHILGRTHGGLVWVEQTPPGCLLADLPLPLPPTVTAWVLVMVAEALDALHRAGRAHGGLDGHRIHLSREGQVLLLGSGVELGEIAQDLEVLQRLYARLDRHADAPPTASARAFADELKRRLGGHPGPPSELSERVDRASQVVPEDARRIEVVANDTSQRWAIDEVGFDLGPDERARGLLDPWTGTGGGSTGEVTSAERTGALDEFQDGSRTRTSALARLARGLYADAEPVRFAIAEGKASAAVRTLVADEPLDALPVPDGVPLSPEHQPEPATRPGVAVAPAEDTGTVPGVVLGPAAHPEVTGDHTNTLGRVGSEIGLPILLMAVILALLAGVAAVWLFSSAF